MDEGTTQRVSVCCFFCFLDEIYFSQVHSSNNEILMDFRIIIACLYILLFWYRIHHFKMLLLLLCVKLSNQRFVECLSSSASLTSFLQTMFKELSILSMGRSVLSIRIISSNDQSERGRRYIL